MKPINFYESQARRLIEAWRKNVKRHPKLTLDVIFEGAPEGDFNWEQDEAGDWGVYCCEEKECPVQWHLTADAIDIKREDGKRSIEIMTVDSDGNWDFSYGWEEGEDPTDLLYDMEMQVHEYFYQWALYWLNAAYTGKDPCGRATAPLTREFCIGAAIDNINYLKMGLVK